MKKNKKHAGLSAIAVLLAAVFLLLALPIGAEDADSDDGSPPVIDHCVGAYLYNFENDEVLYSTGED